MRVADFMLTHMKPIVACFVLSGILLSAQGLDLSFGFGKRAPDPLPPSQVVRIYGFPTHSTALIERQLGELLAAACRAYNKAASCKLHSINVGQQHLRLLDYQHEDERSVVAYVAHDEQREAGQALIRCAEASPGRKNATTESGLHHRCFQQSDLLLTPLQAFLGEAYPGLQELGLEEAVMKAPRKAVFIASDPALILCIHALQKADSAAVLDAVLQHARGDYRLVVEWMTWQHQQFRLASEGDAMLTVHTSDFNASAHSLHSDLLSFLQLPLHSAELQKLIKVRDENGDDSAAGLAAALPRGILAELDAFVRESLQAPEVVAKYVRGSNLTSQPLARRNHWPPSDMLQKIAVDNSLIVTAVDCAAAELAVNWIKSLESNLVPCYLVIAMDGPSYTALQLHVPADRLVIAPPNMRAEAGGAYAGQDSRDFRKVVGLQVRYVRAILDQGYNVAWSDADVAWYSNAFTRFYKRHELVAVLEADGAPELGALSSAGEKYIERHPVSTGFFFLRPSASVYQLLDNWAANLEEVHVKGEQPPFSRALRGDLSRDLDMAVLPMAAFPSGKQSAVATEAEDSEVKQAFEAAWKAEAAAWLHASAAEGLEAKKKLLQAHKQWFVPGNFTAPACAAGGNRRLSYL